MRLNVLFKALIVGGVAVAFMIPLTMIWGVVTERSRYRTEVVTEVAKSTAQSQCLVGPMLIVRYRERVPVTNDKDKERIREGIEVLLPDSLSIRSDARVEQRQRGIYRVPVFRAANRLSAAFTVPARFGIAPDRLLVEEPTAEWMVGVSDPRGMRMAPVMRVDGAPIEPRPGAGQSGLAHGVTAPLAPSSDRRRLMLEVDLELIGTDRLTFIPLGAVTDAALASDWPHPGFIGGFLPDERSVSDKGFEAKWKLSRFATGVEAGVEKMRQGGSPDFTSADLGVRFVQPVDVYQQSERAVKYGFLFVFLTFVVFFLYEVLRRLSVHPIQYILCGAGLALFFLLLVSLSEHLPFVAAYLVASGACVGLLAFYVGHVLHSMARGLGFGGLLGALYGFLYVILLSEDYALLLGALLLFATLAIVMFTTRHVDWYRISDEAPVER